MVKFLEIAFNAAHADYILGEVANGRTVRDICREPGLPSAAHVYQWQEQNLNGFGAAMAAARRTRAHVMADETLAIADDQTNDWINRSNGTQVFNYEHFQRSKLRIGARQYMMEKDHAAYYGDRLALTGANGGPVQVAAARLARDPIEASREYAKLMDADAAATADASVTIDAEPESAEEAA